MLSYEIAADIRHRYIPVVTKYFALEVKHKKNLIYHFSASVSEDYTHM